MEKRNYVKPILNSEAFVPSEYIAVCYKLSCNTSYANSQETVRPYGGHSTGSGKCGDPDSHTINTTRDGIITGVYENHYDEYNGNIRLDAYEAESLIGKNIHDLAKQDGYVTWTTYLDLSKWNLGDNYYHHYGKVTKDKSKNHS